MKLEYRLQNDIAILEFAGHLDCGNGERELRRAVAHLVSQAQSKVVFNLARVSHMDTTCLGRLIAAHVAFERMGGALHLCGVPARILYVIRIGKLDGVLRHFEREDDAIAAFGRLPSQTPIEKVLCGPTSC